MRLPGQRGFAGAVLDAGCGTGENALQIASTGVRVLGVDVAETALASARAKAREGGIDAEFIAADAFRLAGLDRRFATVLDCGLFHSFDGDERLQYVASPASVTERDGTLNHSTGWVVAALERDRLQTRFHDVGGAPAWLATIERA
jgi:2-polyprenyl-3-methyl-5-hydroxy-6-metoxy-1,4-benzoquinol methylase